MYPLKFIINCQHLPQWIFWCGLNNLFNYFFVIETFLFSYLKTKLVMKSICLEYPYSIIPEKKEIKNKFENIVMIYSSQMNNHTTKNVRYLFYKE